MGQTSGKLYDATTQKTWMGIQRAYTEVTMAKVDFSQPTGNESDEDDDEKDFGRDEQGVVDQKIRVGVEGSAPVVLKQQEVPQQVSDQEAIEDEPGQGHPHLLADWRGEKC